MIEVDFKKISLCDLILIISIKKFIKGSLRNDILAIHFDKSNWRFCPYLALPALDVNHCKTEEVQKWV